MSLTSTPENPVADLTVTSSRALRLARTNSQSRYCVSVPFAPRTRYCLPCVGSRYASIAADAITIDVPRTSVGGNESSVRLRGSAACTAEPLCVLRVVAVVAMVSVGPRSEAGVEAAAASEPPPGSRSEGSSGVAAAGCIKFHSSLAQMQMQIGMQFRFARHSP